MFSTADLEIKNVPNPLRRYHLSAIKFLGFPILSDLPLSFGILADNGLKNFLEVHFYFFF